MTKLVYSDVDRINDLVTTFLSDKGSLANPLLRIYKSSNRHCLCYYYEPGNASLALKWVIVHTDETSPTGVSLKLEDVQMMHSLVLGADLENSPQGLLVKLRAPVTIESPLYMVQDETGSPMIYSNLPDGTTAIMERIYVNLAVPSDVEIIAEGLDMTTGAPVKVVRNMDLSGFPLE